MEMACVATWSFGLQAVSSAEVSITEGKSCLDVLEKAVNGMMITFVHRLWSQTLQSFLNK